MQSTAVEGPQVRVGTITEECTLDVRSHSSLNTYLWMSCLVARSENHKSYTTYGECSTNFDYGVTGTMKTLYSEDVIIF